MAMQMLRQAISPTNADFCGAGTVMCFSWDAKSTHDVGSPKVGHGKMAFSGCSSPLSRHKGIFVHLPPCGAEEEGQALPCWSFL